MAPGEARVCARKRARYQESLTTTRSPSPRPKRHKPSICPSLIRSSTSCDDIKSSQQQLCETCSLIDFDDLFAFPSKITTANGIPISKISHVHKSKSCPSCRLFSTVKYPKWDIHCDNAGYHLRALDSFTAMGLASSEGSLDAKPVSLVAVFPGKSAKKPRHWDVTRSGYSGFIASASNVSACGKRSSLVVGPFVDYEMLWRALEICETAHEGACRIERTSNCPLMVLDCSKRIVVPRGDNDYFALSYVWGGMQQPPPPPASEKSDSNSSHETFPRTIEDAIVVVVRLGYRYLWIDRYCIDQNDDKAKQIQIQEMGRIYANAVATIVALSREDSEAGLPGVTTIPRTKQPLTMIKGHLLVSTLPHLTYFIDRSTWASRGWTYQEAMLSRRCLFFTHGQVYFACKSMLCSETLRDSLSFASTARPQPLYSLGPSILSFAAYRGDDNLRSSVGQTVFTMHLNEYTKRSLTYDADAISAFRGIMGNLAIEDYWGIPIFAKSKNERKLSFLAGLLWSRKDRSSAVPMRRCLQFPSWTWANLTVQVGYDLILKDSGLRHILKDPITDYGNLYDLDTEVDIRLPSGIRLPVQDFALSTAFSEVEAPSSLFIQAKVLEIGQIWRDSRDELRLYVRFRNSYDESTRGWGEIVLDEFVGEGVDVAGHVRGSLETQRWWAVDLFSRRHTSISGNGKKSIYFLMVEQSGGVAKRIGVGSVNGVTYHHIPKTRTRFELR